MDELAYSFHLGSDKNKKNSVRVSAKKNKSETTSMSNNAIQNAKQLSRVDKHNYRKYDNNQDDIVIVKGTSSLYKDVKELYLREFEESKIKYNETQRETRKINDYFSHISDNAKNDLACEVIIELGNKKYWDTKDINFKKKMTNVYKQQVEDLELLVPNFKIASVIIHYDETSPHMHIVGVPIKIKSKYGMEKQVGKSYVFTKYSLRVIQDKMRALCIEEFNREYDLDNTLKEKMKGRNQDFHVSEMDNYGEMQEQLEKHQQKLKKANESSLELKESTKDIKKIISDLKSVPLSKNNYVLKQEDKDKLISYIYKVDKTNNDCQNIQELSVALIDVKEELEENRNQVKFLKQNDKGLNIKINALSDRIKERDKEINELKEENNSLKDSLRYFKNQFNKLIRFLKDKMFYKKDRDKYYDMSYELYSKDIIENEDMLEIKEALDYSIKNDSKNRDNDFEL